MHALDRAGEKSKERVKARGKRRRKRAVYKDIDFDVPTAAMLENMTIQDWARGVAYYLREHGGTTASWPYLVRVVSDFREHMELVNPSAPPLAQLQTIRALIAYLYKENKEICVKRFHKAVIDQKALWVQYLANFTAT